LAGKSLLAHHLNKKMKFKLILTIIFFVAASLVIFSLISIFSAGDNNVLISTDPAKFALTPQEVGQPYILDNAGYDKKEDEEYFVKNYGFSGGFRQSFADSNYSSDKSKPLALNEADKAQKFLAYQIKISISLFETIEGAKRYYSYQNKSPLQQTSFPKNLGNEAKVGYNSSISNICYFEKCDQNVYSLLFRNNNVVVVVSQILPQPVSNEKVIELGRIIQSKIK
jgi:hypothetical protein